MMIKIWRRSYDSHDSSLHWREEYDDDNEDMMLRMTTTIDVTMTTTYHGDNIILLYMITIDNHNMLKMTTVPFLLLETHRLTFVPPAPSLADTVPGRRPLSSCGTRTSTTFAHPRNAWGRRENASSGLPVTPATSGFTRNARASGIYLKMSVPVSECD